MKLYLDPTEFLDFEDGGIRSLADEAAGEGGSQREQVVRLYYLVRDRFRYDPYRINLTRAGMKASTVVALGYGFCITKAALFAAGARALKVPSRLGFADVRNHLATARLLALLGTNVFYYHGYAEVELDGRWVKATPAFNLSLCERFRVRPLEFDGRTDSIFHAYDADNCRHMEYLTDRGSRADLPFEEIRTALLTHYPGMQWIEGAHAQGDFAAEATAEAHGAQT
jgi:transglutaminase-like putative cysteine protease